MDRQQNLPPPIATATVARLYLQQGKLDQAEAIYRKLLGQDPRDPRLLEGLAQVQRCLAAQHHAAPDEHVTLRSSEGGLLCNWRVTIDGRERAAIVLGHQGRLALRLVFFPPAAGNPRTIALDDLEGQVTLPLSDQEASLAAAAVGLSGDGDRFVSIAHCGPVALRPKQPTKE